MSIQIPIIFLIKEWEKVKDNKKFSHENPDPDLFSLSSNLSLFAFIFMSYILNLDHILSTQEFFPFLQGMKIIIKR